MARRDQPYLPLYVQDFLTDEKLNECSASSTGVYIRLMCILHKQDEYGVILLKQKNKQTSDPIKNFAIKLTRMMPYDVGLIYDALVELVEEDVISIEGDDRLYQKRMVRDGQLSEVRASAGKKGGTASAFAKSEKFAKANRQANNQANAESESDSEVEAATENEQKSLSQQRFDEFWSIYPNKKSKKTAQKAWDKIKMTQPLFEQIMTAVRRQKDSRDWKRENGRYIPHPATWLNGGCWEDEITDTPAQKGYRTDRDGYQIGPTGVRLRPEDKDDHLLDGIL